MSTEAGDEERTWAADKREFVADRRDQVADERDRVADTRDRTADIREAGLDKWERQLAARAAGLSDSRGAWGVCGRADARAGHRRRDSAETTRERNVQ